MTSFSFTVNVTAEKTSGKFTSKDELADEIRDAIEQADPGSIDPTGEGEYEITEWEVVDA
jgi:hypothetical protein